MHIDFYQTLIVLIFYIGRVVPIPITDIDSKEEILVRIAASGSTVILKCMSNDNAHNFQYWHLVNKGLIIGPANNYDSAKFRYGILSGNLTIMAVSKQEEGLYECVSRAVKGEDMNIRVVKMLVQDNWDDLYQHDYNINLIRILIALITLVLIAMGAWFVYRIWKDRYRFPSYLQNEDDDDDDDESTEELFSQPSTSKSSVKNIVVPSTSTSIVKEPQFDEVDIDTDFKSILSPSSEK
ncbi:uncharacterized protein LOC109543196 [Dendroctonus ponderosae]|uniref:uncharacterized protein LOC109543196 n=1 Tax=Dendroctonus ponderosae TaxID=77166 RepID=UPI002036264E|nr:uncharacterized protein LOC109543196 [Dendroctonus ponderosae]XP_019768337.2 uncharacterized protein LOC109543196 [Dendroctonus ponderosae]XP_019768339.2 uncharacterized protein LOC109543196 [Dendroctonus ponderosae]XP_019768341.2 uncharacterized protein LOC109543196 [Dendroctonus ponderosae]XP_048524007.1 uncharacterized protein LOC109543196 [Dendroctonus ponderosae]KAH1013030.1 hypothetical protein HUJ05_012086 [Dendroctonus ponderosae]KAH1013032.1 hypothetical protein HUJ05_012086 [Dend